ncbi:ribosomal protein S18 acetylase RimI-like enzyme [Clostridium saccharoperbutylacetonicum]|uniref:GCN5-related N-acetyltransferase n=1 Tax=Clostridium saccharoperbutylacetonicum N1-4(HMT) TaxID=931276 RepID=M1N1L7_9CLOT|nr:GNAT family N-acetyltransferase [Clostridium saccharoperbutylacetonicum]AGF57377.1 GCN5-related N-acetyltransferase [Clostridium saccharoperbutylacetonicum N1-4(HMT)]NRT61859.1 ribosomal protein S18 acetylase RimI-like enzyme [Clostridium saccharoperbutylacetonicum]NSB25185.1 ribosomal protein S18 acetylase RimI-like enzyme [Clostridium saccharoperbutylacetonicum]NSB44557.1 ribosomal protein S18 acetylase RimI-like enzyme [Clostridium saccharoperbutylacetonicum]
MQEINQKIIIKQYLMEKEYKELKELEEIIKLVDKVNLKLELDYKLELNNISVCGTERINEFLYYEDGVLVSYLGISCFGGNVAELNGMTHPKWRRKGKFKKLFELAKNECINRNFKKILLLTDGISDSGKEFIKAVGGQYDFTEYGMELLKQTSLKNEITINLRKAEESDNLEIARQDLIYFSDKEDVENVEEIEEDKIRIETANIIELNNITIGKIHIKYDDNSAFILGFGILPEFRGKGFGKTALKEALKIIKERNISNVGLDVAAKNKRALNLYKSCGFEEKSTMDYYKI